MRISDWSSDVCSSDLRETNILRQRIRMHSVSNNTWGVNREQAIRNLRVELQRRQHLANVKVQKRLVTANVKYTRMPVRYEWRRVKFQVSHAFVHRATEDATKS